MADRRDSVERYVTTNRLDELRRLLDEAMPGPWGSQAEVPRRWLHGPGREGFAEFFGRGIDENAALIVFLRNHAEDLLAVARASEEVAAWIQADGEAMESEGHLAPEYPWTDSLRNALSRLSHPSEEAESKLDRLNRS